MFVKALTMPGLVSGVALAALVVAASPAAAQTAAPGEPGKARVTTLDVWRMVTGAQACTDFYQMRTAAGSRPTPFPRTARAGAVRRAAQRNQTDLREISRSSPPTIRPRRAPRSASSGTSTAPAWTNRRSRRRA